MSDPKFALALMESHARLMRELRTIDARRDEWDYQAKKRQREQDLRDAAELRLCAEYGPAQEDWEPTKRIRVPNVVGD